MTCECPDFYPLLGDTWLLKFSSTFDHYDYYLVGTYDGETFTPQFKVFFDNRIDK